MRINTWHLWVIPTLFAFALGCSSDEPDPEPDPDPDPVAQTTWHQDIAPIVFEHCVGCHSPGGIAPFELRSFADAGPIAGFMLAEIEGGNMPPWSAVSSDDCEPRFNWIDDPRLSDDELELFRQWVDDGAPEGDPDTAAELPAPPSFELADVTMEIQPDQPYTTSGFVDELVCFVLDPQLTEVQWLTGLHFEPGNLEVAHHATLAAIPPAQADEARSRVGPDGSFRCTGGVGIEGAYPLGVWVPGARPFVAPSGTGTPLAPGSVLVMQMHYHPTGFEHQPDSTRVQMTLQDANPGQTFLFSGVGNAGQAPVLLPGPNDTGGVEFRVPANVADHTESMVFELGDNLTQRVPVTAVFPHMHYVGVDLEVRIRRANPAPGEPSEECLVKVPAWDFDWQRTYFYDADIDELPTLGAGDSLEITCRYDNTLGNDFVRRMLLEEGLDDPIDVFLGEETTDEMCLAAFGLIL